MLITSPLKAQRFLSDYDSTLFIKDTLRPFLKRMENLHFSGYIQPQFQVASSPGIPSYEGGNFADSSSNRFMLRRARIRVDYILPSRKYQTPMALFAFQYDITERGAFARDIFLKIFEPKHQHLSLTMGLFARPYGFEVNLSSAVRESPERGRMSQTLMPAERDLGFMVSYETKNNNKVRPMFKFDIGLFNGQGLSGTGDFDSYKDLISRIILKPYSPGGNFSIGAGLSLLYGGWKQTSKYVMETGSQNGNHLFVVDSSLENKGAKAPRHYYGADVQLTYKHAWGRTELRGEYWKGTQPGTALTTTNPGTLPTGPTYIRQFDGAFLYFIQNIVNKDWEFIAKFDWYDPNREVSGSTIGSTNFTAADIKYSTLHLGLNHYFTENLRAMAFYHYVKNESTALAGYEDDVEDNVFTLRLQLRF